MKSDSFLHYELGSCVSDTAGPDGSYHHACEGEAGTEIS